MSWTFYLYDHMIDFIIINILHSNPASITYKEKSLIVPLYKAIVRPHLGMESISQERHRYA